MSYFNASLDTKATCWDIMQVDPEPWVSTAFSADMETVAAATPAHAIYLYSLVTGTVSKVLTLDGMPCCHAHILCWSMQ